MLMNLSCCDPSLRNASESTSILPMSDNQLVLNAKKSSVLVVSRKAFNKEDCVDKTISFK
jgi:hypothetical protein